MQQREAFCIIFGEVEDTRETPNGGGRGVDGQGGTLLRPVC